MKKYILAFLPIASFILLASFEKEPELDTKLLKGEYALIDLDTFDDRRAVEELRKQIAGREDEPAEDVFKNIQSFKGMPAGRLLNVMRGGFNRALGVSCNYCHNTDSWESEEKKEKQIARDMKTMTDAINAEYLSKMSSLRSANAIVNCSTCHRGQPVL